MKNSSDGYTPNQEPAEAALMQEFGSYLTHLSSSFAGPLADRLNEHERELVGRIKKLADDIDHQRLSLVSQLQAHESELVKRLNKFADDLERQRVTAAARNATEEAALVAKVKGLADAVDLHRVRVAETQDALMRGLASTVAPLQETVASSTASFDERAGQVVGEFTAIKSEVATLSGAVSGTRTAVWAAVVVSLASLGVTLWFGLRR